MVRRLGKEGGFLPHAGGHGTTSPTDLPPTYVMHALRSGAEEEILHGFHRNGKRDGC